MRINALFIGLLAFHFVQAQQTSVDSLRRAWLQEPNPIQKLDIYYNIANEVKELDPDAGLRCADTLEQMGKAQKNIESQARATHLRGTIFSEKGEYPKAIQTLQAALNLFQLDKDKEGTGIVYNSLGAVYKETEQNDSAIVYYLKAADIYENGAVSSELASLYANIGNLYVKQKLFDKGIGLLQKALDIRLKLGDEKKSIYTYNNLAVAYGNKGDYDQAMVYSKKGIDLALKFDNKFVAGVISGGMGYLMLQNKHYNEAIQMCEQAIQMLKAANRETNLVFPLVNLASVYNALGQPQKALAYANEGYIIMQKYKLTDPLEVYYEEMANANEKLGNYKEALGWFKQMIALDDSLFKAENNRILADTETKYQTQKKEAEIARQQLQIESQQSAIFRQRTWIIALLAGLLAIGGFGYLFHNRYRLRQKAEMDTAVIREQRLGINAVIEAQEAERQRIAKDLHDGIAQELVALKLSLLALQAKIKSPGESDNLLELTQHLDHTCTEVRNLSHTMLPPTLQQFGLAPSLELLLRNTIAPTGISVEFQHHNLPDAIDPKIELGLYRIVQELLNNTLKHASAAKIIMQLYQTGNKLVLHLEDNGRGFDFESARQKGSMGLLNIISRVSNLGGDYRAEPAHPQGTISIVRIPL